MAEGEDKHKLVFPGAFSFRSPFFEASTDSSKFSGAPKPKSIVSNLANSNLMGIMTARLLIKMDLGR